MIMENKLELLAPAGKWEALVAAVQNGADAVYLGEQSFSARKNAANFTWEEIENAVRYCHIRGVRVFLALNTLIGESELSLFESAVKKALNLFDDEESQKNAKNTLEQIQELKKGNGTATLIILDPFGQSNIVSDTVKISEIPEEEKEEAAV